MITVLWHSVSGAPWVTQAGAGSCLTGFFADHVKFYATLPRNTLIRLQDDKSRRPMPTYKLVYSLTTSR